MRKYVIGAIAGALLVFAGQAAAETVSKIGKMVQAEFVVKVDGKELEARGLAIDGQTTVPARALAEAVGYDVSFVNKEVILERKESDIVHNVPELEQAPHIVPESGNEEPTYTLESITLLIEGRESELRAKKRIYNMSVEYGTSQEEIERWNTWIAEKESELERLKSIKAELEAKK